MKRHIKRGVAVFLGIIMVVSGILVTDAYLELKQPGVIVLLYHRVSTKGVGKYVIRPEKFKQQMEFLKTHGYKTIISREIVSRKPSPDAAKTIILTFDDGTEDHYRTVYPILKKYGFKGIFFIITKYIGSPGNLTAAEIREMSAGNMEIGSHTYSHPFLDQLADGQIRFELKKSKQDLENIIDQPVISLAPPGGWFDERTVNFAKLLRYRALFSCEIGFNDLNGNPFVFKRIEVTGSTNLEHFRDILKREDAFMLKYKITQTLKFLLHATLGSDNYSKLGKVL